MSKDTSIAFDLHDKPPVPLWLALSTQHVFAMFGATVLVPYLTGLSPAVALVTSGLGTLLYILITGGGIPAYLGSSFAFIGPIIAASAGGGMEAALWGCAVAGLVYAVVAALIAKFGVRWLLHMLPPIVIGPIIMVIGLGLAKVAVEMATGVAATKTYQIDHFLVALFTLFVGILFATKMRGVFALVPVLFAVIAGYIAAWSIGLVDFTKVAQAPFFELPNFIVPSLSAFDIGIVLGIAPVAFVTIAEHIGDQTVLSKVCGRNFLEKPGLHRSLLGDGLATTLAALLGGPPNTTYGENIGVMAITRVISVFVIGGAACLAILFGMIGKVSAFIQTIPPAVMGGICILLFGVIASSGLRMMIDKQIDFANKRNLIISSVILVIGIGGAVLDFGGSFKVSSMALAAVTGIILNMVLPGRERVEDTASMFASGPRQTAAAD